MPASAQFSPHAASGEETLAALQTDSRPGLSRAEAQARLQRHGPNALPETKPRPLWRILLAQFQSPLIYILLVW